MRAMDFLTLLGEMDETAAASVVEQKKRRPLWVAAAACFFACVLGFSAWFFLPPNVVSNQVLIFTVVRVEDQLLSYKIIQTKTMSRFELLLLPDEQGEVLMTHGDSTFYRVAEAEDLVYLIQIDSNGNKTGTVIGNGLNVRSGAGTDYPAVATLNYGDRVTLLEEKTVGDVTWGKIDKGWISLEFVSID